MSQSCVDAWIALGGNLGDARQSLLQAISALGQLPHTRLLQTSSLYRTAPIDSHGPDYLNAVAHSCTGLPALELLDQLQALELAAGRTRPYPNAPRTLDLDILLYGDERIDHPRLQVPHPRMTERAFVLVPLHEIAPQHAPDALLASVAHQQITCHQPRPASGSL